jgi:hypothetical protein
MDNTWRGGSGIVPLYLDCERRALARVSTVLLVFLLLAGCVTSEVDQKTRSLNQEQLDALQKMQNQQVRIQRYVESFEAVGRADVLFLNNGIRITLYFKPGKFLGIEERDKINEFVMQETGLTIDKIQLPVKRLGRD